MFAILKRCPYLYIDLDVANSHNSVQEDSFIYVTDELSVHPCSHTDRTYTAQAL